MFIDAGGHSLSTVQIGTGDRTFVAHGGWTGGWELWLQPLELMQAQWRGIAYDHRGSGASTAPADAIGPQALVEDLFAVLDAYDVDRCVLAAESMGAMTCLQAVVERPERFEGLVLVGGLPAPSPTPTDTAPIRADYPATAAAFIDACVPEPDSEHLRRWGRQIMLRADPEAAARLLESFDGYDAPDLTAVTVPTLVVHGELDVVVPLSVGEAVAAAVPGAELVVIPGAGHVPTMTRPHEVVDAITSWAARVLPQR